MHAVAGADRMAEFWDARAREDAFFFVDNEQSYKAPDVERFFAEGARTLDALLDECGMAGRGADVALDIGCGLGRLTRALAERVGHVHALDVSPEMLTRARELNAHLGNVTWHRGDGRTLQPLADSEVDAVVSHVVFQHVPDPEITYGYVVEIGRVLRPGGWAAFQVSNDPRVHEGLHKPPSRLKTLFGRAPRGQRDPAWRGSAVDLDALERAAREGGCAVAHVSGAGTQFCCIGLERA